MSEFCDPNRESAGRRVIATPSTANQDLPKQLGADVAVDYTKTKFEDVAKDVDAVLDPVGKERWPVLWRGEERRYRHVAGCAP